MRSLPFALLLALVPLLGAAEPVPAASAAAPAEKEGGIMAAAGHSMSGEAFNEGPRQKAVLLPGMGTVHFPVTTKNEEAQKFFEQGVAQLHGFWYFEAERSFRQVAALDGDCATAFWGMAMANINNQKRAAEFIKEAVKRKQKVSPREQLWIDAFAAYYADTKKDEKQRRNDLIAALENLSHEFPEDLEVKAFLVFQLWDNSQHGVPLPSRQAVDAIAQQVLAKQPMHPGIHHYLIHLWNQPGKNKRALLSAARGGQAAPGIAHLWHMPGHTFSGLKRYAEAAWQQEAGARVDHAYMRAARIMPEQIHNYAHNNDWLVKNLAYVGRVHDAVALAKNLIELPRLGPTRSQAHKMGRERLLEMLVTFELWDELLALEPTIYLETQDDSGRESARQRMLGVAAFSKGDRTGGQARLDALKARLVKLRAERIAAADKAEAEAKAAKKPDDQIAKAMADALRGFASRIDETESAIAELRLTRALAAGDQDEARKQLPLAKQVPSIRRAQVHFALGEFDLAEKLAREAADADEGQLHPRAILAGLLWEMKRQEPAIAAFKKLRERSAGIDLDVPVFARLAPLAAHLELPTDWRLPATIPADAGERPDLATLGPFRWEPYPAPVWSLPDRDHRPVALADFKGTPVLAVFYLGSGCAHCIEQLNALAPLAKEFATAGIELIAISTETPGGLQQTFAKASGPDGFPFRIVSDHELDTFRGYRAYDDFENMALHGIFLIDGEGRVRWQNISYQPFKELKWLVGEAKRLLRVPGAPRPATAAFP